MRRKFWWSLVLLLLLGGPSGVAVWGVYWMWRAVRDPDLDLGFNRYPDLEDMVTDLEDMGNTFERVAEAARRLRVGIEALPERERHRLRQALEDSAVGRE